MQGLNVSVPHQKLRVCETGSLGKLGEKVPISPPTPHPTTPCVLLLKERWQTGNVYAPDPEKKCFRSNRAHILNSEVVIDRVLNRGFMTCHRADLLCARNFSVFEGELQAIEGE